MTPAATQVWAIARRSIVRTLRQPANVLPGLLFPTVLMALNSGGLDAATSLPGFPSDSFLAFMLAVPFVHGALFATMNAGTELARDVQTGFLDRLSLTSIRGSALIAGQLAGIVVLGLVQSVFYLAVGLAAGVDLATGVLGALTILGLGVLIALAFGSIGAFLALRTGSGEAVQSLFPFLFVFLFFSSMNLPRHLIELDWFRTAASVNPVSYLVEGVRSLVITGWDGQALALAFSFAFAIAAVGVVAASLSLRTRLTRT